MRSGQCLVVRNNPGVKVIRPMGAQFLACWSATGAPDYLIVSGGQAALVDAKLQSKGSRWQFSKLHDHQAATFSRMVDQGGRAGVLLRFEASRTTCLLMWDQLGPRWKNWWELSRVGRAPQGSASLSLQEAIAISAWTGPGVEYLRPLFAHPQT